MKTRKIKKQVKRFLSGKTTYGIKFHEEVRYPTSDGKISVRERVPDSIKFHRLVNWYIGGPVCHWDSPYVVEIVEEDGEICHGHSAQFC